MKNYRNQEFLLSSKTGIQLQGARQSFCQSKFGFISQKFQRLGDIGSHPADPASGFVIKDSFSIRTCKFNDIFYQVNNTVFLTAADVNG